MTIKKCYRCQQEKEETLFKRNYKKRKDPTEIRYTNLCSVCDQEVFKVWRKGPKQAEYNKKYRERRLERKKRAIIYKGSKCEHCSLEVHPAAFDFHHLDKTQKDTDPGLMMSCSDEVLFLELDKCVLLCANCHRVEHFINGY